MKVQFKLDDQLTFEVEAESQVELFKQLASLQEVFGDRVVKNKDGKTSDKVKFQVRRDKDENEYLEFICVDELQPELRWSRKRFGQHKGKSGSLFPKGGWVKYNKEDQCEYDVATGKKVEKEESNS